MALTPNIKRTLAAGALSIGLAFGAAAPALAQDASANENIQNASLQNFETVDHETAKARSAGGIVLHVGNGFPEVAAIAYRNVLADLGYNVELLNGGPANELSLCIDNQCFNKNFDERTARVLIPLVEQHGGYLLASRRLADNNI